MGIRLFLFRNPANLLQVSVLTLESVANELKSNPSFVEHLFQFKSSKSVNRSTRNPYDEKHYRPNQITFSSNSVRSLGQQV